MTYGTSAEALAALRQASGDDTPDVIGRNRFCPSCGRQFWLPAGALLPVHITDGTEPCPAADIASGPGTGRDDEAHAGHEAAAHARLAAAASTVRPRPYVPAQGYPHSYVPDSADAREFWRLVSEMDAHALFGTSVPWSPPAPACQHTGDPSDGDRDEAARYAPAPPPPGDELAATLTELDAHLAAEAVAFASGSWADEIAAEAECPSCGSPERGERCYVPGPSGQPVDCGSDWHDDNASSPGDHAGDEDQGDHVEPTPQPDEQQGDNVNSPTPSDEPLPLDAGAEAAMARFEAAHAEHDAEAGADRAGTP